MRRKNLYKSYFLNIVKEIAADKIFLFVLFLFSALYLPQAFILVDDLGLIQAYENDPGSHIDAIKNLLRSYNMHAGFHSKYYGWTYFAINFFILLPLKLFCQLVGIESKFLLFFTIRLILFIIGLASLVFFYKIVRKLFSSDLISLAAALFYIFSPVGYSYFYFIHPETTGALFIFAAILNLLKFINNSDRKFYCYGLISLVLASLSKQVFFLISLPILILFFHFYCQHEGKKYFQLIASKEFLKIIFQTALAAFAILFLIHPNAILEPQEFISYQAQHGTFVSGLYVLSVQNSFEAWLNLEWNIALIRFFFITAPLVFLLGIFFYHKNKNPKYLLAAFSVISAAIILILIANFNRLLIEPNYIQPLYSFFIFNLFATVVFIQKLQFRNAKYFKKIANIFFAYFIILTLASNICEVFPKVVSRFFYKDSAAYKSYDYIKNNLNENDKLAYDHFVALPDDMKNIGCHYWQKCGTDYIDSYDPNYVIFNENYSINGKKHLENERLKKYVKEKNLHLVTKLTGEDIQLSVYKK